MDTSSIRSIQDYSARRLANAKKALLAPIVHEEYEELCPDCRGGELTDRCQCSGTGAVLNIDGLELLQFLERYGFAAPPRRDLANPDIRTEIVRTDTNRCFWCGDGAHYDRGRGFLHRSTMNRECGPEYPGRTFASTAGHQTPGELNR